MQKSEEQQFLYEVSAETLVADILQQVVEINNLRAKIQILSVAGEQLCRCGPTKPIKEPVQEDEQQSVGNEETQTTGVYFKASRVS